MFDAYGTLHDIQSVATLIEQALPGCGKIITRICCIKQFEYTSRRSLQFFEYHLEFNSSATNQAIGAVHEFLKATIGGN